MKQSPLMTVMIKAVRKAGRALVRDFGEIENLQVSRKGPMDFVTSADKRSESLLVDALKEARPDYCFLTEETGVIPGSDTSQRWIIDPLDGTTNFMHGVPLFCISLALEREGRLHAGVIYNPVMDELFFAEKGSGAYFNDRRLRVASRTHPADSLVTIGTPRFGQPALAFFKEGLEPLQKQVAGLRRTGSAALDLAWVAAGRFDAYIENGICPWDVAAGMVLVREAGGLVTDFYGRDDTFSNETICAANPTLHARLLPLAQGLGKAL